jgi:hypothetical protein
MFLLALFLGLWFVVPVLIPVLLVVAAVAVMVRAYRERAVASPVYWTAHDPRAR